MNGILEKQRSEFVQNVSPHGGIQKRNNNYYWRNREYWLEYKRNHYIKNKERYKKLQTKWVNKNKERVKTIKDRYINKNRFRRMISVKLGDIKDRCTNKNHSNFKRYGGRGITNFLTVSDLIYLWNRDNAKELKRASIDRINNDGNYTLDNCRFIEMTENASLGHKANCLNEEKRIKVVKILKSSNKTTLELAKLIKSDPSTIRDWLNGRPISNRKFNILKETKLWNTYLV